MLTPIKWLIASFLAIFVVLGIAYSASVQNLATLSSSEVDGVAESIATGVVRDGLNEDGDWLSGEGNQFVDKDELIANLTVNLVSVQKTHGYDIALDYIFLDESERITEDEVEIRSMQLRIELLDDDGELKGSAERRIAVNMGIEE